MSRPTGIAAETKSATQPSSLLSATNIILLLAAIRVVLYLLAAPHYGYFRDELYYLACGEHPAWGYVDQPPLIAWIAWLLQHSLGTSLWALRLLPALAGCASIALAGHLALQLGGRRWAVFLAGLATLMAPILLAISNLFTMNAFDLLLWTCIAVLIARLAKTGDERLWIPIGAVVGVTILNKYAVLFWISGLLVGLVLTPLRQSLRRRWFWLGVVIAAAIALPNFLWQWRHRFPFFELMHNVRQGGRDIALAPLPYLGAQAQMLGYCAAVLIPCALFFFFSAPGRRFRALGWAYLIFLAEMLLLHGKMYYLVPVYPMIFAAGAVWIESHTARKAWTWLRPVLALAILVISGIYLPTLLPVLSVPHFLAYEHRLGIEQQKFENARLAVLPQLYADMFGWEEMTQQVAAYYRTLSPADQKTTAIYANNYGEGGAIDFFGPRYGLPKAIGGHQNYWIWGPRGYTGENIIVLGEGDPAKMQQDCASYTVVGTIHNPLSRPDEWLPIYDCRGFKWNLQTIWPRLKRWQ
jgi:hypothetical protein